MASPLFGATTIPGEGQQTSLCVGNRPTVRVCRAVRASRRCCSPRTGVTCSTHAHTCLDTPRGRPQERRLCFFAHPTSVPRRCRRRRRRVHANGIAVGVRAATGAAVFVATVGAPRSDAAGAFESRMGARRALCSVRLDARRRAARHRGEGRATHTARRRPVAVNDSCVLEQKARAAARCTTLPRRVPPQKRSQRGIAFSVTPAVHLGTTRFVVRERAPCKGYSPFRRVGEVPFGARGT